MLGILGLVVLSMQFWDTVISEYEHPTPHHQGNFRKMIYEIGFSAGEQFVASRTIVATVLIPFSFPRVSLLPLYTSLVSYAP